MSKITDMLENERRAMVAHVATLRERRQKVKSQLDEIDAQFTDAKAELAEFEADLQALPPRLKSPAVTEAVKA